MLELKDLWYRYPQAEAEWSLVRVSLKINQGEFLALLGPSGCGKTTLLRLIAGFDHPIRGSIHLRGQEVASPTHCLPVEQRGVGMVFQDGALFPHLTVWQNACFGLKRSDSRERVHWLLDLLGIATLTSRYPHELSGGQRQRLALARSLAPAPSLLLLDEPFSNLDVEVRLHLRQELPTILSECGATAVMVTHDPEEALAICSRVGVMRAGGLMQLDRPEVLVKRPATAFVAGFVLGSNLLPLEWHDGSWTSCLGPVDGPERTQATGEGWELMIHPESLVVKSDPKGKWRIISREFLGTSWRYKLERAGQCISAIVPLDHQSKPGDYCAVSPCNGQDNIFLPRI